MAVETLTTTRSALKEWAVAVKALAEGRQVLLLRKGGIHEKEFALAREAFLLYPTFEHQRADLLQEGARPLLETVLKAAPEPGSVTITHWAQASEAYELTRPEQVAALAPHHIWAEHYVEERLRWRPVKPLLALLLRVHRLPEPVTLPVIEAYGGCKSWIELEAEPALEPALPVLDEAAYAAKVEAIRDALRRVSV